MVKIVLAREILNLEDGQSWRDGDEIFFLVRTEASENTGTDLARVSGTVRVGDDGPSSIARKIKSGKHGKISLPKALVVSPNGSALSRPRLLQAQITRDTVAL